MPTFCADDCLVQTTIRMNGIIFNSVKIIILLCVFVLNMAGVDGVFFDYTNLCRCICARKRSLSKGQMGLSFGFNKG